MSGQKHPPSLGDMEGLFVNNPKLEQIRAYLGRFNPIKVMGMEGMEIRHSAILAWLLNPQENHGLGDKFLRGFLAEALRISEDGQTKAAKCEVSDGGQPSTGSGNNNDLASDGRGRLSALDVLHSNMMDAEVQPEWEYIDLLVLSPENKWAFVIENKFHSGQSDGQLEGYMDKAEEYFQAQGGGDYKVVQGIFLTLWHEEPQDKKNRYVCIRYKDICRVLRPLVEQAEQTLGQEVQFFINHYLEVIEEASNMSETKNGMVKLARKLYRENRAVIDFVADHGRSHALKVVADELFGDVAGKSASRKDFICSYPASGNFVGILPASWFDSLNRKKLRTLWEGEKFEGELKLPLIVWIEIVVHKDGSGHIALYAQVGPLSGDIRVKLIEAIGDSEEKRISFSQGAIEAKGVAPFFRLISESADDLPHDAAKISDAIKSLLIEAQCTFDLVKERLEVFRKEHEKNS